MSRYGPVIGSRPRWGGRLTGVTQGRAVSTRDCGKRRPTRWRAGGGVSTGAPPTGPTTNSSRVKPRNWLHWRRVGALRILPCGCTASRRARLPPLRRSWMHFTRWRMWQASGSGARTCRAPTRLRGRTSPERRLCVRRRRRHTRQPLPGPPRPCVPCRRWRSRPFTRRNLRSRATRARRPRCCFHRPHRRRR